MCNNLILIINILEIHFSKQKITLNIYFYLKFSELHK